MEASFSPPNLKRIGYPKNTIYMKSKQETKLEREIEEREKLGVSEEHTGHWCYDDVVRAKLSGIKQGKQIAVKEVLEKIDNCQKYELFEGNKRGIFIRKSEVKQKIKEIK